MAITDEQIGANVAILRKGKSQKDIAAAMKERGYKWSQATVWSIEKGERPLRLTEALDLAVVLDADMPLIFQEPASTAFHQYWMQVMRAQLKLATHIEEFRNEVGYAVANSMHHAFLPEDEKQFRETLSRSPARIFAEVDENWSKWDFRLTESYEDMADDLPERAERAAAIFDAHAAVLRVAWGTDAAIILDNPVKNV
jgi:transcriptional regulator with XRE-family HTH domain